MKYALLLLLSTSISHASYLQQECGNSSSTLRYASGHSMNEVVLTIRDWGADPMDHKVKMNSRDMKIERDEDAYQLIDQKTTSSCLPGESVGHFSRTTVSAEKFKISKNDGSLFSKDIVGVSKDLKFVEDFVLCEMFISSRAVCPAPEEK